MKFHLLELHNKVLKWHTLAKLAAKLWVLADNLSIHYPESADGPN